MRVGVHDGQMMIDPGMHAWQPREGLYESIEIACVSAIQQATSGVIHGRTRGQVIPEQRSNVQIRRMFKLCVRNLRGRRSKGARQGRRQRRRDIEGR